MNQILSKIKDVLETLFYAAIVAIFLLAIPIWIISSGNFIFFVIMYLPIILFVIIGFILSRKDKKYEQQHISSEFFEDDKLGKVKIVKDNLKNISSISEYKELFEKYEISIRFNSSFQDSVKVYLETLAYIKENQIEIEQRLKNLYLSNYEKEEVENKFKVSSISSESYKEIKEYCAQIEEHRFSVEGEVELNEFLCNASETDLFLCVYAESVLGDAFAYINCRTKQICYCLDNLD